jgi:hypothetical protein
MTAEDAIGYLGDNLDFLGRARYGMSTAEKEALAAARALPGAPPANTADAAQGNRYAAGYLFTKQWPNAAPYILPAANFVHGLAGDSETVQSQATAGMNQGLLDVENQRRARPPQSMNASDAIQALLAAAAASSRRW